MSHFRINLRKPVLVIILQEESVDVTANDLRVFEGQLRVDDVATNHAVRFRKIMFIMAVGTAERDDRGNSIAAAARPSATLLIVGAARRHITQGHARKRANIDTDLHGRRARKHVYGCRFVVLPVHLYILKKQFVLFGLGKDVFILRRIQLGRMLSCDKGHGWARWYR